MIFTINNGYALQTVTDQIIGIRSVIECMTWCMNNKSGPECVSLSYDDVRKSCQISNKYLSAKLSGSSDIIYQGRTDTHFKLFIKFHKHTSGNSFVNWLNPILDILHNFNLALLTERSLLQLP